MTTFIYSLFLKFAELWGPGKQPTPPPKSKLLPKIVELRVADEDDMPDPRYVFQISKKQARVFEEWANAQRAKKLGHGGAIGGAYVWTFCSTTLGQVVTVRDDRDGSEIDLTFYEDW